MNSTESKRNKLILFVKKLSISTVIIFIMTFVEMYWSMGELSDRLSSGCPECGFFEDTLFLSFLTGIFLSVIFSLFFFIKKSFIRLIAEFLLLITLWLFCNYFVFVDRESSWSTYDFASEIHYTVSLSFFPVTLLGFVSVLILHYNEINARFILKK